MADLNHNDDDRPKDDSIGDDPPIEPTVGPGDHPKEDFATIDSSVQKRPAADDLVGDPEQTIDSSIQQRPKELQKPKDDSQHLSDVSTILPLEDDVATMDGVDELPKQGPERIASFRLLGVIGVGGMGKVYLAMQDRPRRHVALKVMKGAAVSEQALRRFEFEAELLARLVHPGIAQIYEAGAWDDGDGAEPYFAMEYVPSARSMTAFCRERKLERRAIVEMMIAVCDAVGFGHGKGIIHRDLKPGNILVGSKGRIKIIDFGVARSTDSDKSVTMQTDVHAIVGTLQYMAPEQCTGDVLDLDTSADVYALGITLYQLLTGQLPYEVSGQPLTSAIRIVAETVPERIGTIDKSLAGDLDVIVQKSLAKDRAERYRTASEFGDDLRRWLNDEPISAAPPTLMVLVRRAIRRNKGLVAAAAGMAALVVISIVVGGFALVARNDALAAKADTLQAEKDLLQEQAKKRAMVGDLITFFMRDSFDAIAVLANSQEARENLISVSLDYLEQLRSEAGNDPSLKFMLADGLQQAGKNRWSKMGGSRGDVTGAVDNFTESVGLADELREAQQAQNNDRAFMLALTGRALLYDAYRELGRRDEALAMLAEAEELAVAIDIETADFEAARAAFGLAMDRSRLTNGTPDKDPNMQAMLDMADVMSRRFPAHLSVQRDATLAWNKVAFAWSQSGAHDKAVELYERSRDVRMELLKGHEETNSFRRDVLNVNRYIAREYEPLGRKDEAATLYRLDIIPLGRELVTDSPTDMRAHRDLAIVLAESGSLKIRMQKPADAARDLVQSRDKWVWILEQSAGDQDSNQLTLARFVLQTEILLAQAHLAAEQFDKASEVVSNARTMGETFADQWPHDDRIKTMSNSTRELRAIVLEKQAAAQSAGQP